MPGSGPPGLRASPAGAPYLAAWLLPESVVPESVFLQVAACPGGREAEVAQLKRVAALLASRAFRNSCRRPLGQAAELDEQLDLDAADVIQRGAPRAVTVVGGHGQAFKLRLRVRHIAPDEAPEIGESLGVEQLAQLLDRPRAPLRIHQVAQDLERQVLGRDDLRRALGWPDRGPLRHYRDNCEVAGRQDLTEDRRVRKVARQVDDHGIDAADLPDRGEFGRRQGRAHLERQRARERYLHRALLRVGVKDDHAAGAVLDRGGQVQRRRSLADAALLVRNRDAPRAGAWYLGHATDVTDSGPPDPVTTRVRPRRDLDAARAGLTRLPRRGRASSRPPWGRRGRLPLRAPGRRCTAAGRRPGRRCSGAARTSGRGFPGAGGARRARARGPAS